MSSVWTMEIIQPFCHEIEKIIEISRLCMCDNEIIHL